ncbi:MAG: response regulator transcription factor [Nitrospirota bacterium]|nr:response regulator transcription factor [Nitrospirota bacterium]
MKTITILLADDHAILRKGLSALFEEHRPFMEVVGEAKDGRTAVQLAKKLHPQIVLMDIALPELNGVDATRIITAECHGVKVIALSMHNELHFVVEMLRAGASGYLLKECSSEDLIDAIRSVIAGRCYISGSLAGSLLTNSTADNIPWRNLSAFSLLSAREREVLHLLTEGKNTRAIAVCLGIGVKTVETHRQHLMKKLQIDNLPQLTKYAIRESIVPL